VAGGKQRISALRAGIEQRRVQRALAGLDGDRPPGDEAACDEAACDAAEVADRARIEQARARPESQRRSAAHACDPGRAAARSARATGRAWRGCAR
jgi:hypothetical protein